MGTLFWGLGSRVEGHGGGGKGRSFDGVNFHLRLVKPSADFAFFLAQLFRALVSHTLSSLCRACLDSLYGESDKGRI